MNPAVAEILEAAEQLSASERAELADHIVESLAHDVPPEIERAQLAEVRRRITRVESGDVALIPGRRLLTTARTAG